MIIIKKSNVSGKRKKGYWAFGIDTEQVHGPKIQNFVPNIKLDSLIHKRCLGSLRDEVATGKQITLEWISNWRRRETTNKLDSEQWHNFSGPRIKKKVIFKKSLMFIYLYYCLIINHYLNYFKIIILKINKFFIHNNKLWLNNSHCITLSSFKNEKKKQKLVDGD